MKKLAPLFLILLALPMMAFAVHKYYVSVTNVRHDPEERTLQVTSRIFIDDFENVLEKRYGLSAALGTKQEDPQSLVYIEKYLRSKLVFKINGKPVPYTFLGREYQGDQMVCYVEVPGIDLDQVNQLAIENEVLTDLFEDQQNIVHFHLLEEKHSFVLYRENNKGMLKL